MDFRAALLEQTDRFGDLIAEGDPQTPVPTCPDWTLRQLFRHVGRGHRWAAQIIAERRAHELDPRDVRDGRPPDDPESAAEWLRESARLIVNAVDRVGSDARVWTFLGPRPAGWWVRRRLHEATVHRADAAFAIGTDYDLDPELAADAVSETLERVSVQARGVRQRDHPPLQRGQTVHLHATDDALGPSGEWTVHHDEDGIWWSHDHGKGTVAVRGPATEVLLAVSGRRDTDQGGLEIFGDADVWNRWLERTRF
ncbi:maleylpyruvate isomerase family mycothiol-dependent enzyme [Mycolicibacterium sp. S2-37]|uniref:maleylpyruvate isomerase family mycothiol-dependent enzyme n=1 Tax=Mycolicibacterium sp. S2-37 TaxID=2810297 RepID=UPI001A94E290|nr:maleylpyruvate isomerase family mycothiol-dependent enzyme [Mycolicibacterium sp. S2-37]MBO0681303.1 maleylpyruvate isomerase family mycothiol-dependent enzyme [Mycolicibacterium sp. S2-37]